MRHWRYETVLGRVFIAEGDESLCALMSDLLVSDGFEVVAVTEVSVLLSYLDACQHLLRPQTALPDVVIVDTNTAGLAAEELLQGMRETGLTTPVILVDEVGDEDPEDRAQRAGALTVLEKPVDVFELRTVIRRVVSELELAS